MLEFFRNIDYSTKGEVLSGFTDEVVKNILIDYYQNNLKLNEIIKKYSIHTIASNLRKEFPKVSTSFICEICDEEKYIQLPTKTDYNKLVNNDQLDNYFVQDNRCFSCGHKNNDDDCSCDYCSKVIKKLNKTPNLQMKNFQMCFIRQEYVSLFKI